jgi:hypothetical protein
MSEELPSGELFAGLFTLGFVSGLASPNQSTRFAIEGKAPGVGSVEISSDLERQIEA